MMNTPTGFTGPVNIGNPDEFTVEELAKMTIELTGSASKSCASRPALMIRRAAVPTSRWQKSILTGSRRFRCAMVWRGASGIFAAN